MRIGAAREGIEAPARTGERRQALAETGAERAHELSDGVIGDGGFSGFFQFAREGAAEIAFDQRSSEGSQVIARDIHAVARAIEAPVNRQIVRALDGEEQFIREAERQVGGGLDLVGQIGREAQASIGDEIGRQRDDHGARVDRALRRMHARRRPRVVDQRRRATGFHRQVGAQRRDQRAKTDGRAPVDASVDVAVVIDR